MKRNITLGLIAVLMLIAGCSSDQSYLANMKDTQTNIELIAQAAYNACQENQSQAVALAVVAQRTGKPLITADAVNETTKQKLDVQWMEIELQIGGLSRPPEQYQAQYETIRKMYESCQKLYQLATEPTGLVEQYQFTTDVLHNAVAAKGADLTELYAGK
jgi:hypothetical protein